MPRAYITNGNRSLLFQIEIELEQALAEDPDRHKRLTDVQRAVSDGRFVRLDCDAIVRVERVTVEHFPAIGGHLATKKRARACE